MRKKCTHGHDRGRDDHWLATCQLGPELDGTYQSSDGKLAVFFAALGLQQRVEPLGSLDVLEHDFAVVQVRFAKPGNKEHQMERNDKS